jgi:hypothetical protein
MAQHAACAIRGRFSGRLTSVSLKVRPQIQWTTSTPAPAMYCSTGAPAPDFAAATEFRYSSPRSIARTDDSGSDNRTTKSPYGVEMR